MSRAPPPTFRLLTKQPGRRRTKPRSPAIRARARRNCAPASAPMRRRATAGLDALLPRLPALDDT